MIRRINRALSHAARGSLEKIEFLPSQLAENFFYLPVKSGLQKYSLESRPYFYDPYNLGARNILLKTGRQVGKSTWLEKRILSFCALTPFFRAMYVSPTNTQTTQFSNDRIRTGINYSELLKAMEDRDYVSRIHHKSFRNGAEILLKYAFYNADRIRGNTVDLVAVDEVQDMIWELLPVIEECLFTSEYKFKIYSGTPKSTSNTIELIWQSSTQCEWVVPCDHCGSARAKGGAGRTWNILGESNIGRKGVICAKCKQPIYPRCAEAHWRMMNPNPVGISGEPIEIPFFGFHISQLMHPLGEDGWIELLDKYKNNPRDVFFNETLGLSYDSGLRPLTPAQLKACCSPHVTMREEPLPGSSMDMGWFEKHVRHGHPCYMGIDWGVGSGMKGTGNTYTVVSLATYVDHRFVVFNTKRLTGEESEPKRQVAYVAAMVERFRPRYIGADYGGGGDRNDTLIRMYGPQRMFQYQYANMRKKAEWSNTLRRFLVNRTDVMTDIFNAIKRGDVFSFPRWEEWRKPYAQDCLNIFGEYNDKMHCMQYTVSPGTTDDTFHSILYCFLASTIHRRRPDVFVPVSKEKERQLRRIAGG